MKICFNFHRFYCFLDWHGFRVSQDAIVLYKVNTQVLSIRRSSSSVLQNLETLYSIVYSMYIVCILYIYIVYTIPSE